jgi:signal transduction histidine kinase
MAIGSDSPDLSGGGRPPDEALIGLNRLATVARLLSGAVHEVNNALQVISGTVEVLESRPDVPPSFAEALARLRTQSTRAAGALAQVLHFTRAERDARVPLNMREIAEESLALRQFAIRRARLTGHLEVDGDAPCLVIGNRGDLQQALLNMLINAEQALAGTTGAIRIHLARERRTVVVRVIDDGGGVTLDPPERVFDPFVTTRPPFEAAGLGLWAARVLVEQHGGTLTLEANEGTTALVMRLPAES